jgi:class 3 adenylate cyclase
MDNALALHDSILRSLLLKHYGHEVTTEGDSFTMVFHEPLDSVSWCLAVQQVGPNQPVHLVNIHNKWKLRQRYGLKGRTQIAEPRHDVC